MAVNVTHNPEKWEQQFRQNGWDFLKSELELPRYSVISSYMKQLGRPISLLDVGCGEGLIVGFCDREWLASYSGLDPSRTALDRIENLLPTDRLICSALEEFSTEQRFDVILFNEVLYYTSDPESHLNRFRDYLNPGGFVLISAFKNSGLFACNSRGIRSVWSLIERCTWKKTAQVVITDIQHKLSWNIVLMQP
jgi:2-polyprenyl-3-methyl-5-hydroxy-6-metoxy-1,4-benzoquinol methylase